MSEMEFDKAAKLLMVNVDRRSKHEHIFKDRDYHEERLEAIRKVV